MGDHPARGAWTAHHPDHRHPLPPRPTAESPVIKRDDTSLDSQLGLDPPSPGVVVAGAGAGLLAGRAWGRVVAIVLALCSAVVMFALLPQYPLWALIVIALSVAVIWAVATADR
jgi:hypothetical protein